jgi:hypothetical protein
VRRWALRLLAALGILLVGLAAAGWWRFHPLADVGAGYVAKVVCSCVHVGGRDFASCRSDVPASMDGVRAEPTPDGDGVRAFVPLLAERVARLHPGTGCVLE